MELAFLLRRPLYELTERMTYEEYIMWGLYFSERPAGWREDDRTYKILRGLGVKAAPESIFSTLAAVKQAEDKRREAAKPIPRSGSFLHAAMLKAKGGKKLDFLKDL